MLPLNRWVLVLVLSIACAGQSAVAHKAPHNSARLEGYVHDESGRPVKGVMVSVNQGSYTTQGETAVIPLIFPKAVGFVALSDPDVVNVHYIGSHLVKTDKKGHFVFKKLPPGQYTFAVRGVKKYYGDIRTSERGLVPNRKLQGRYSFPESERVALSVGQVLDKDVILHGKQ
jgi:protocatechuate 3,4-dioxygenase beta subunit